MRGRLTLYQRAGCHLCEEARAVLDASIGPDAYQQVDIDADDDLVVRYGFRVPVIAVDGVDRLEAPMTAGELQALIRAQPAEGSTT
jgi:glutaredoxin